MKGRPERVAEVVKGPRHSFVGTDQASGMGERKERKGKGKARAGNGL